MVRGARRLTAVAVLAALSATLVVIGQSTESARAATSLPGASAPLQEFVNDGFGGRTWNAYNQTQNSAGPTVAGRPSAIGYGPTVHVYARAADGDLNEFINDGSGAHLWDAYDLSQITGGPAIAADPDAAFYGPIVHVYAESSSGDLIEFVNDGSGAHLWNFYDLTEITSGPTLGGDPTPSINGPVDRIFARGVNGDLVEFVNDGVGGRLWNSYDITQLSHSTGVAGSPNPVIVGSTVEVFAPAANGDLIEFASPTSAETWSAYDLTSSTEGPTVAGRPSPVVLGNVVEVFARGTKGVLTEYTSNNGSWTAGQLTSGSGPLVSGDPSAVVMGGTIHVYAEALSDNDLLEFYSPGPSQAFTSYDLSTAAAGPTIGGSPGALVYRSSSIHVYAPGPIPDAPPAGVGVYGLDPGSGTTQAIEDNWPIVGDTGALGTQTSPYTGLNMAADFQTGQDIAASGERVTWLSFWTVSGPVAANPDGSACYTSTCYYNDAYAAGRFVATTIDSYKGQGLPLKPDWVIIDPEGFPDNHSGLDSGPGATTATWSSFLTGWAQGIAAVDPSLQAAFYADQYEYNTFDLAAIQLPAFVALAFPSPQYILNPPTTNVAGFVAFGATCPASSEEQTLENAPWGGTYNTLQFSGSQYCAP